MLKNSTKWSLPIVINEKKNTCISANFYQFRLDPKADHNSSARDKKIIIMKFICTFIKSV